MRFQPTDPPRVFQVNPRVSLKECAVVDLEPDEQVTFRTEAGGEYDVVRKSWGFYATPSLNGRLQRFGLRAVLVKNRESRYYLLLVERGREAEFEGYLARESQSVLCWLDTDDAMAALERGLSDG
jgi:hypothetical protein